MVGRCSVTFWSKCSGGAVLRCVVMVVLHRRTLVCHFGMPSIKQELRQPSAFWQCQ
jgi:hypothetical protein